jgi:hypothetical protein
VIVIMVVIIIVILAVAGDGGADNGATDIAGGFQNRAGGPDRGLGHHGCRADDKTSRQGRSRHYDRKKNKKTPSGHETLHFIRPS